MSFVKSFDGTKIYYEKKGKGVPVILLPSCGVSSDFWKYQDPLGDKYLLIKLDIAGVGKSGRTRKEYSYTSFAQDIKAVVEKEKLKNIILLGHGQGAVIAIEAAILLQNIVKGIISVDSLIPHSMYYGKKATQKEIDEVMSYYSGNYQEYYDNLIRGMLGDRVIPEIVNWVVSIAGYEVNDPTILREIVRIMLYHDYHEFINKITCPIKYLLQGYYKKSLDILAEQKDAKFMDNVGHMMNIENPKVFNQIVDEFITELEKY
ncbi:MAG: alpha/beta hydrolase [Candidatus Heimdallarchaeota archaeon]|nr:alpha/beta hydrolase [Candidatus Heimdallarchaeota archaeon]